MIRLRVWANAQPVGWLGHEAAQYFFQYDVQWVQDEAAFPLAPQFELRTEPFRGDAVKTFFANLLPEGTPLDEVLSQMPIRNANTFELMGELGAELPGVLSVLPEAQAPDTQQTYSKLSQETLSARVRARASGQPLLTSNAQTRMSLAGAQDKVGLRYDDRRDVLYNSVGGAPTTHIAKPDSRLHKYQPSAINEYLCMKLAHEMRLPVPPVHLLQVPETVYLVQRYDRRITRAGVVCLHQIDACQLLSVGADWKYERQGGFVSLPKIVKAFRDVKLPGKDLLSVQRWVMFNYLIGNSDAHAKNISVMVNNQAYGLAPFYDLMCVQAYGDHDLALFIGDESTYETVGVHSWKAFCHDCGFAFKPTMALFRKMAKDVRRCWDKTVSTAIRQYPLTSAERALIERIGAIIDANSRAASSMSQP
ncbi:HipA domain-containing protein [Limnohabitans sp.]|jgi:serine/threonine-protein kinase HipA|uniref:HipA domain-containing protein n=1 Tax=Limnohabitans sp. TaxID=1907725 RepID=UPI0037C12C91